MLKKSLTTFCLVVMVAYGAGPLLDHCFPERDPFHTHIEAGPVAAHVEHYLLPVHQHEDGMDNEASDQSVPVAARSLDASGRAPLSGFIAVTGSTLIAGLLPPELASSRFSSAFQMPPSAVLSPPDRPPRA